MYNMTMIDINLESRNLKQIEYDTHFTIWATGADNQ